MHLRYYAPAVGLALTLAGCGGEPADEPGPAKDGNSMAALLDPDSPVWAEEAPERFTARIECAGLYWHFVDLVWIFLFPSLYLL